MQGKRFKNQSQDQPAQTGRASGAHFAKPPSKSASQGAPAPARPYPQVQSIQLPQPVQQTNRQMVTGEFAKVTPSQRRPNQAASQQQAKRPQPGQPGQVRGAAQNPTSRKISPLVSAAIPRVSSDADDSAALRRAVITGVSGSMKKIPSNTPARKVSGSNKAYSRYSNGYFDRPEAKQLTDYVAAFQTEPTVGAPAYSWMAFAIYGALSCVASVGWAVVAMVSGAAPLGVQVRLCSWGWSFSRSLSCAPSCVPQPPRRQRCARVDLSPPTYGPPLWESLPSCSWAVLSFGSCAQPLWVKAA